MQAFITHTIGRWGYLAVFQWAYKGKRVTAAFVQALFGRRPSTDLGP